jgi:hypothetical protein
MTRNLMPYAPWSERGNVAAIPYNLVGGWRRSLEGRKSTPTIVILVTGGVRIIAAPWRDINRRPIIIRWRCVITIRRNYYYRRPVIWTTYYDPGNRLRRE